MAIGKFMCSKGHYVSSAHARDGTCPMCAARDAAIARADEAAKKRELDRRLKLAREEDHEAIQRNQ
jgi:hypothetical protein